MADFQVQRLPDLTFNTTDQRFIRAIESGEKIVVAGQPGYVINVKTVDGHHMKVTFRPSGKPHTPPQKPKISLAKFASVFKDFTPNYHAAGGIVERPTTWELESPTTWHGNERIFMPDVRIKYDGTSYKPEVKIRCETPQVKWLTEIVQRSLAETFNNQCWRPAPAIPKETLVKVRNRFYVAAPSVTTAAEQDYVNTENLVSLQTLPNEPGNGKWTRHLLKDTIEQAEKILEANPKQDHVAIVQIVRIVRRKKMPLVVETVR